MKAIDIHATPSSIKAIIIDDEQDAREALRLAIQRFCMEVEVVASCSSVSSGIQAIQKQQPDLVFLDIQMPYQSGFDLLEALEVIRFEVIFVTAYEQYALRAIKFSALDYLLKPVDIDELARAIERVVERRLQASQHQYQAAAANLKYQAQKINKLAIPALDGILFLPINDIIFCQADGNYTHLMLQGGKRHLVCKKLKDFEGVLSHANFCRVHHSALINVQHIEKYVRGEGGYVIMKEGHHVDVSRRKKEALLSLFASI